MLLQVENNIDRQQSTLYSFTSVNGTAGGTVIPVKNINGFQSNWTVQLGKTGEEQAEIVNISGAVSGTALNTGGTIRYPHPMDTPVYQIHYDSVIFLRSTTGTTGTPTAIATVTLTPDSFYTEYNDASGVATYAYQTQFFNSVSSDVSGTSSWFVPGGPTFYSLQKLRQRAKDNLYSANYIRDDSVIDGWINEYVEVMTNSALKVNQSYSIGTTSYTVGTAGLGTITEPLFKYASKIEISTDNGVTYRNSTEIPLNQFTSTDVFSPINPRHYWQGNTVFGILPASAGTVRMSLGQLSTQLVNDSDEMPQFLKGYTTACTEYVLYRAYSLDQKDDVADRHYQKFVMYQNAFVAEITPRDPTGIKMIDFVETTSGFQEDSNLPYGYF